MGNARSNGECPFFQGFVHADIEVDTAHFSILYALIVKLLQNKSIAFAQSFTPFNRVFHVSHMRSGAVFMRSAKKKEHGTAIRFERSPLCHEFRGNRKITVKGIVHDENRRIGYRA